MVVASPKFWTTYSALAELPGAISILEELAVTSTEVEAGMIGGKSRRQNSFPAVKEG